jgi:hypothetical protein
MKLNEILNEGMLPPQALANITNHYEGLDMVGTGEDGVYNVEFTVPELDIETNVRQTYAQTMDSPAEYEGDETRTDVVFYGKARIAHPDNEDEIYYMHFMGEMFTVETDATEKGLEFEYEGENIRELFDDFTRHLASYAEENVADTDFDKYDRDY